jgi:aminopeptidase N
VGDEAFYKSLQLYLTRFAYKNAEIHDLRMCFEEVSGRDLNWFFNQWFLKAGHPQLEVKYSYSNNNTSVRIIVKQNQDSAVGLYTIPLVLDVYTGNIVNRENVVINHKVDTFDFSYSQKISLTNIDAEKVLLGILKENKTDAEYLFQLQHADNFIDKKQAVAAIINIGRLDSVQLIDAVSYCLNHPFYGVKELGINLLSKQKLSIKEQFETQILSLVIYKDEAIIRSGAINTLADIDKIKFKPQILNALNDSAYSVVSSALSQLVDVDEEAALRFCKDNENSKSGMLQANIASIYTMVVKDNKNAYFKNQIGKNGYYGFTILSAYGKYLKASNDAIMSEGIDNIIEYVGKGNLGYNQYAVKNILNDLRQSYNGNLKELEKSKEPNPAKAQAYKNILLKLDMLEAKIKLLSNIEE